MGVTEFTLNGCVKLHTMPEMTSPPKVSICLTREGPEEGKGVDGVAVGVGVFVGVGVSVSVLVGVRVDVGVGVSVGRNNCPSPQLKINKLVASK